MENNIQNQESAKICPRCGIENTIGSFCKKCGAPLEVGTQSASPLNNSNSVAPFKPSAYAVNPYTKAVRIMAVVLAIVCVIAYLFLWTEAVVSGVAVLVALFSAVFSVSLMLALMHMLDDIAAIRHNTENKRGGNK